MKPPVKSGGKVTKPAADTRPLLPSAAPAIRRRWVPQAVALAILFTAGVACYHNSFECPQVFDGVTYITSTLENIWRWHGLGQNRPVGIASFALNYAWHGQRVWGYHAVNLAIHVAAAWLLFGIARHTLGRGRLAKRYAAHAWGLALAISLLWLVHPLDTESVTYIYQRLESLMGMFYLATLWCFVMSLDSAKPGWWRAASVVCCALGMGSKEAMVTAPLIVLWYDRAFAADGWREIFSRRGKYYAALAGTWGILAALMIADRQSYSEAGLLQVEGLSPLTYALSQPGVILHYLQLSFWPDPLCLDYDWPVARGAAEIVLPALAIGALVALALWAAWRWPAWGFLGGCFFLILAPTSSVVPIKDLAFEHRMYLPLAAVVAIVVMLAFEGWQRLAPRLVDAGGQTPPVVRIVPAFALFAVAIALGCRTVVRNADYGSELAIWRQTARERPTNARAHGNLGKALAEAGDLPAAIAELKTSIDLDPGNSDAYWMLGDYQCDNKDYRAAIDAFTQAVEVHRHSAAATARRSGAIQLSKYYLDRAEAYSMLHDYRSTIADCNRAVELVPDAAVWYFKRACIQGRFARHELAAKDFSKAIKLNPKYTQAYLGRAEANLRLGQRELAIRDYTAALNLRPGDDAFRRHVLERLQIVRAGKDNPGAVPRN